MLSQNLLVEDIPNDDANCNDRWNRSGNILCPCWILICGLWRGGPLMQWTCIGTELAVIGPRFPKLGPPGVIGQRTATARCTRPNRYSASFAKGKLCLPPVEHLLPTPSPGLHRGYLSLYFYLLIALPSPSRTSSFANRNSRSSFPLCRWVGSA